MKKLAVAVGNLGPSQLNYHLIKNANELVAASAADLIVFYENLTRPCLPLSFASMPMAECWGYDGTVIATSVTTAEKVLHCPGPTKRYFYVWDLEWMRPRHPMPFGFWRGIYGHPDLTLLARGEDHKQIIEHAWNREVRKFDLSAESLLEL